MQSIRLKCCKAVSSECYVNLDSCKGCYGDLNSYNPKDVTDGGTQLQANCHSTIIPKSQFMAIMICIPQPTFLAHVPTFVFTTLIEGMLIKK